ncbi:unnamed protein product [Caenorhabditis angaria]|uniref:Uncharacterized protein n=1 Tax=Caenorhabditis angaria TaxID=860376 RepID=A0A9P1I8I2_9PELO|nr:unnamed protein product [Caenorhabditis angaria]
MRKSSKEMNSRRVSLPVALAIPQQFPSRLSPPSPASPASPATRRSLPTSPICRRSLPSTPRTISPRRLTNLLPDVDEHFPSTSSSSENSPRRVKKKRPPPRYQYSLQSAALKRADSQAGPEDEEKPEGSLRSFDIKNGQVVDNGYKNVGQPNYNKDRRATCPEVYLFPETGSKPMRHVVLRIYGFKGTGKKSLLNSLNQYATRLVTRYNVDPGDEEESCSKIITFLLNNEPIELEILLESTLENSPFASCLTMYAIMYNVDSKEAFLDATCLLERLIHRKIAANPANIILVGNKVDLKRNTVVGKFEGACLAKLHKCNFIEISATLSMNLSELWNIILKQVQTPPQSSSSTGGHHQNATSSTSTSGLHVASTWMTRIFSRTRQFAHSAEQIVSKIL